MSLYDHPNSHANDNHADDNHADNNHTDNPIKVLNPFDIDQFLAKTHRAFPVSMNPICGLMSSSS